MFLVLGFANKREDREHSGRERYVMMWCIVEAGGDD